MLSLEHEDMLVQGSTIDQGLVQKRNYESICWTSKKDSDYDRLRKLGFDLKFFGDEGSGFLIPMYSPIGDLVAYQYRSDEPIEYRSQKTREIQKYRYLSVQGQKHRLDIHPLNTHKIADKDVPLIITEGVKKADSLTSRGQCVIALTGVHCWRNKFGTLGDWEDVVLKDREITILFDSDTHNNKEIAKAMVRLGNWLKYKQAKKVNYLIVPKGYEGIPTKGADDYFVAGGTWNELWKEATTAQPDTGNDGTQFTDVKLAEFAIDEVFEGKFIWTDDIGWMEFDGRKWCERRGQNAALGELTQFVARKHTEVAEAFQRGEAKHEDVANWVKILAAGKLLNILKIVATLPGVYKKTDEAAFDFHHDLLNCPNGVVDLRTGELLPHDPEYMMTKMTAVEYHKGRTHELWTAALEALPEDVREWAQIRYGQGVTGHVPDDEVVVLLFGRAENGKTTLFEGINAALGNYSQMISPKVLLPAAKNDHTTEMASLEGLRFAYLEETSEAGRLDVTRVKQMTNPFISARKMRRDDRSFNNTTTLFLATNFVPTVVETDDGSWRRLMKLDFPYKFKKAHEEIVTEHDRRGIGDLKARLKSETEPQMAILTWLVDGAKKWYANSRGVIGRMPEEPQRVKQSTYEWRLDTDMILKFFNDCLIVDPNATVATTDLTAAINTYLTERERASAWSEKRFNQRFQYHSCVYNVGIEKGRFRVGDHTSRPVGILTEPLEGQYAGYKGVRFRTKADEEN